MARVEYSTVKMKRSNVPGKVPTDPSTVDYGELLVNYAEGKEFVAMKNSKNEFVKIVAHPDAGDVSFNGDHSDEGFTGKTVESSIQQIESEMLNNEKTVAGSLNDLNERIGNKNIIEGIQRNGADLTPDSNKKVNISVPTDAAEIAFSGSHNLNGLSGDTVEKSITDIEQAISDNEKVVAAAINDLNEKIIAVPEATVTGVATEDKVLSLTDKQVSATISLDYGDATSPTLSGKKAIKLVGKNNAVISEIDASDLAKTYKAGNGLVLATDGTFSIDTNVIAAMINQAVVTAINTEI